MRSGGFRVIFNSFGKAASFGVDCKIFEDRIAVLAAPEMVVFFVIQFAQDRRTKEYNRSQDS